MYNLLKISLGIIARKFPKRSILARTELRNIVFLYGLTLAVDLLEVYLVPGTYDSGESLLFQVVNAAVGNLVGAFFAVFFGRIVLNKYAEVKLTLKEMLTLTALVFTGADVLAAAVVMPLAFLGEAGTFIADVASLIFGIYMLFIYRDVISSITGVTKDEAVRVIAAPIVAFLVVWMVFGLISLGVGVI